MGGGVDGRGEGRGECGEGGTEGQGKERKEGGVCMTFECRGEMIR